MQKIRNKVWYISFVKFLVKVRAMHTWTKSISVAEVFEHLTHRTRIIIAQYTLHIMYLQGLFYWQVFLACWTESYFLSCCLTVLNKRTCHYVARPACDVTNKMVDSPVYWDKIFHEFPMQYLQQELYSPCSNSTNDSTTLAVKIQQISIHEDTFQT